MKKSIWIFLLAVLLPSVVLGWLALRSAEEQQIILEKRTAELYQKETENAATAVRALIDSERRAFNDAVRRVLANKKPQEAAPDFSAALAAAWPRKSVGFALGKDGRLISPSAQSARKNAEKQRFLLENSAFLCSTMPATVYWVSGDDLGRPDVLRRKVGPEGAVKIFAGGQQQQIMFSGKDVKEPAMVVPRSGGDGTDGTNGTDKALSKVMEKPAVATATAAGAASGAAGVSQAVPFTLAPMAAAPAAPAAPAPAPAAAGAGVVAAAPAPSERETALRFDTAQTSAAGSGLARRAPLSSEAIPRPRDFPPGQAQATAAAPAPLEPAVSEAAARAKSAVTIADAPDVTKAPASGAAPLEMKEREKALTVSGSAKAAGVATISGKMEKAAGEFKTRAGYPEAKKTAEAKKMAEPALDEFRTAQDRVEPQFMARNVAPQRMPEGDNNTVLSQITPSTAEFRTLTAGTNEGVITRFVQDQLDVLFWVRPAQDPEMIFGCLIASDDLSDLWPAALPAPDVSGFRERIRGRAASEFALALLDDKARPVATQPPGETGRDWKRPFVASEIGEALPHWEAALYLQRPEQLREFAVSVRRTLTFLIAGALAVIACGGWLVVADARRQLALAQQKTDFVSNVSHELKTPLTSIRMFAELMQSERPGTVSKHPQYLRIIMVEAERLTRLINNVLDFARIERKQKRFDKKPLDLHEVIARIWEGHELHLREAGFSTHWEAAPAPYPVIGDEDALAQILVNLLSNAEKYSSERKEVELQSYIDGGRVCVSVLDRGMGVPAGEERKIYEAFYRAHDSLSSGVQGSGLGLTLAQRMAREHGGEILYQAREGGGSNFTLRLPLAPQSSPPMASL